MTKLLGSILLILAPFCDVLSQNKEYVFTRIDREMGLRSNNISHVIKDHKGVAWIGTNSGLHWFDGQRMVAYTHRPGDSSSLPDNRILRLMEDTRQKLWVVTGVGPAIFDRVHNNFSKVAIDSFSFENLNGIFEDNEGNVWLTMYRTEPYVYDSALRKFQPYTKIWPRYANQIRSLAYDSYSHLYWLATDSGLAAYDPSKRQYYDIKNNPLDLRCFNDTTSKMFATGIDFNSKCELWIQGFLNYQMYYARYDVKKKELVKPINTPINVTKFFTDASGTTWGLGEYLSRYDSNTNSFTDLPKKRNDRTGMYFDGVESMFEDDENNLWLATNLGVYVFNPQQQAFHSVDLWSNVDKDYTDKVATSFLETKEGLFIVFGYGGDGIYFHDKNFTRIPAQYGYNRFHDRDLNYSVAWCGLQDQQGLIWVGCESGRIIVMDPQKKTTKYLKPPEFQGMTIRAIGEDEEGNIWFGTLRSIVVKWIRSENKFKQVIPFGKEKYKLGTVVRLVPGYQHDMWATTFSSGLIRFDIRIDSIVQKVPNTGGTLGARDIIFLNRDTMIFGSGYGVGVFDMPKNEITYIDQNDEMTANDVLGIGLDEQNNVWVGTINGVCKIRLPQKQITNYGFTDGITEEAIMFATFYRLSSGKMVFGNTRGFVYYDPKKINSALPTPNARITGVSVFNNTLSIDSIYENGNLLRLPYNQNSISFRFSAMSFRLNDRLNFYYQMEGVDKDWKNAGTLRELNYSHLGSGDYLFKVKTISSDNIPSEQIASLKIHIDRPFWNTWWFYLLCAAAIGGLLYLIYRLRVNRILAVEKVRRRVARDLHDDMGSTLSTINILSEMARMKIRNDVDKTTEYIGKISDNSSRMMEAIDDIVWSINPLNDSMQKIMARMREFATSVLEAKDIDLDFKAAEEVNHLTLDMEARRDFFLIFKEAVNNAAKYSKCKHVRISINVRQQRLLLDIIDDGIGFDVNVADNGNGLINMRKRADSLKGKIVITSSPGLGTQVFLNVPV